MSKRSVRRAPAARSPVARRGVVLAIVCGAIAGASFLAVGREPDPPPRPADASIRTPVATTGRLLIDGRIDPEKIGDASAAAIFLPMIAPSANATGARADLRLALLGEAGLTAHDADILERVLAPLHQEVEEKRRLARAARAVAEVEPTAANMATLQAALADLKTPATAALARLRRELSADGVERLQLQLDRIKANTKLFG